MHKNHGYTLVELAVAIAIVAALSALVFPVVAQVRAQSTKTVCLNNTHQLAMGLNLYLQDYDERIPFPSYDRLPLISKSPGSTRTVFNTHYCQTQKQCSYVWADLTLPYVRKVDFFSCPADGKKYPWHDPKLARLSYAMSTYLFEHHGGKLSSSRIGPGPSLMEIANPSQRILLSETSNELDTVALWCFRSPQLNHAPDQDDCSRKRGKIIVAYLDGHARLIPMRGLLDRSPYSNSITCAMNAACVEKHYPEWAPWLP